MTFTNLSFFFTPDTVNNSSSLMLSSIFPNGDLEFIAGINGRVFPSLNIGYFKFKNLELQTPVAGNSFNSIYFRLSLNDTLIKCKYEKIKLLDSTTATFCETITNEKGEFFPVAEFENSTFIIKNDTTQWQGGTTDILVAKFGITCDSTISLISPILPTEVRATCNNGSIVINWKDNSHVEYGYIVYRSSSANGTYQTLDTLSPNSVQYIDTSAFANTAYWYKVASYNNIDTSYNNLIDSVTTCNVGIAKVISSSLKIYPNPASQSIVLSSKSLVNTVEVNNLLGQHQHVTIEKLNTNDFRLTTEYLPSGIYFIKATDINGNVLNGKFVKE